MPKFYQAKFFTKKFFLHKFAFDTAYCKRMYHFGQHVRYILKQVKGIDWSKASATPFSKSTVFLSPMFIYASTHQRFSGLIAKFANLPKFFSATFVCYMVYLYSSSGSHTSKGSNTTRFFVFAGNSPLLPRKWLIMPKK